VEVMDNSSGESTDVMKGAGRCVFEMREVGMRQNERNSELSQLFLHLVSCRMRHKLSNQTHFGTVCLAYELKTAKCYASDC